MTTTARELANNILMEWSSTLLLENPAIKSIDITYLNNTITQAILDAEARGRESVLSKLDTTTKAFNAFDKAGCFADWYDELLAKLKEPT